MKIPLDSPTGLFALAVAATILLLKFSAAVSEFLLGRYLARNHPDTWLSLGRPGKPGSFGREPDYLTAWLKRGSFEAIDDWKLHAKCRFVRRLSKISLLAFVIGLLGMVGIGILRK